MTTFTSLFPFCGLGAGARGFLDAQVELLGQKVRFESMGGIDIDAEACKDFERLTGSPALQADIATLTLAELRAFCPECPDVIFTSPPCKGFSGLLSKKAARKEKYRKLNRLVTQWLDLVLAAWDERPRLILLENVPRIASRGASLLKRVRSKLHKAGYVFSAGTHDCGELGGLAQYRVRYLLVARHPDRCPPLLYQPPKRRVRGCGEVLEQLPLPGTIEAEAAGSMHRLPRLSWINWVRLALIPAGGDWRDLDGVLAENQKRHAVGEWSEPTGTVCGGGSSRVGAIADPRVEWRSDVYGVRPWERPSRAVIGGPSNGADIVADPRVKAAYDHGYRVLRWDEPSFTVAGKSSCGTGAYQVADPRVELKTAEVYTAAELMSAWDGAPKKAPPFIPVIISPDRCWHRPLTTLELAALQGLPTELDGQPLELTGGAISRWRERIGNACPVATCEAIGRQMLVALTEAAMGEWSMSSGPVWVAPEDRGTA